MKGSKDVGETSPSLDLRGLRCPLPVLKTAKRLAAMQPGETVTVLSDDPLAALDLPAFCRQEGQGLLSQFRDAESGVTRFVLERGRLAPSLGRE